MSGERGESQSSFFPIARSYFPRKEKASWAYTLHGDSGSGRPSPGFGSIRPEETKNLQVACVFIAYSLANWRE